MICLDENTKEDDNNDEKLWQCWHDEKIQLQKYIAEANQTKQHAHLQVQTLENEVVRLKEAISVPKITDIDTEEPHNSMLPSDSVEQAEDDIRNAMVVHDELANLRQLHDATVAEFAEKETRSLKREKELESELVQSRSLNGKLELKVTELQSRLKNIVNGMLKRKTKSEETPQSPPMSPPKSPGKAPLSPNKLSTRESLMSPTFSSTFKTAALSPKKGGMSDPSVFKAGGTGGSSNSSAKTARNLSSDGNALVTMLTPKKRRTKKPQNSEDLSGGLLTYNTADSSEIQTLKIELSRMKYEREVREKDMKSLKAALVVEQNESGELLLNASMEISRLDKMLAKAQRAGAALQQQHNRSLTHCTNQSVHSDFNDIASADFTDDVAFNGACRGDVSDIFQYPIKAAANSSAFAAPLTVNTSSISTRSGALSKPKSNKINKSFSSFSNPTKTNIPNPTRSKPMSGGWSRAKKILM